MTPIKKRRIFLTALLFPTIIAVAVLTVIFGKQGRAKYAAKKWLRENHPQSELLSVTFTESDNGEQVEKGISCECYDSEYGFFFTQEFESNGFRYVPADRYACSYALMTDCRMQAEWYAQMLTEKGYPCDVICYPNSDLLRTVLLPENTDPEALAAFCAEFQQMTQGEIGQLPEILVCAENVRKALLSADGVSVWRNQRYALPLSAADAAGYLLSREVSCSGVTFNGAFGQIIESAQENSPPDDSVLWQITPWQSISGGTENALMFWELK